MNMNGNGKKLEGKVALVTGGSRGIGRAIAFEAGGRHSYIYQANISNLEQVNRMRDEVIKQFGKVDILVNNAGIVKDKSFVKMTPDMWDDVISVNLDGTFYCTKAFIEGMLERKYGRIVNISSVIGRMGNFG